MPHDGLVNDARCLRIGVVLARGALMRLEALPMSRRPACDALDFPQRAGQLIGGNVLERPAGDRSIECIIGEGQRVRGVAGQQSHLGATA